MKTVIIESPYSGDVLKNIEYAKKCLIDSCKRGEAPFLSHLLYTTNLEGTFAQESLGTNDENHWISREEGLKRCEAWRTVANCTVFYVDYGWSSGMLRAKEHAEKLGQPIEERKILN